jgi:hypothetical protein
VRTNIVDGDRLWNIVEVAEYLAVPVNTLRYWRTLGRGPRCSRLGKHLRYRAGDVQAWVDSQGVSDR